MKYIFFNTIKKGIIIISIGCNELLMNYGRYSVLNINKYNYWWFLLIYIWDNLLLFLYIECKIFSILKYNILMVIT